MLQLPIFFKITIWFSCAHKHLCSLSLYLQSCSNKLWVYCNNVLTSSYLKLLGNLCFVIFCFLFLLFDKFCFSFNWLKFISISALLEWKMEEWVMMTSQLLLQWMILLMPILVGWIIPVKNHPARREGWVPHSSKIFCNTFCLKK